jgi:hypothetical protein
MKDFPEDAGEEMSEARHGYKMLLDSPQGIATPTVRVRGQLFFVNELLRREDRTYFIPERFFAKLSASEPGAESTQSSGFSIQTHDNLMALGRVAHKTEVSVLFC